MKFKVGDKVIYNGADTFPGSKNGTIYAVDLCNILNEELLIYILIIDGSTRYQRADEHQLILDIIETREDKLNIIFG